MKKSERKAEVAIELVEEPVVQRGNVLVIGGSGVGKSTLINAVIGEEVAPTSWGKAGTEELKVYEAEDVPFRLIDSMGFEASSKRQTKAVNAVKKWSKECAKRGREDNQINLIWFCVDGTSARLFDETITKLNEATSMWKSVPVIAVITKSYSDYEREQNVRMVRAAFEPKEKNGPLDAVRRKKDYAERLRRIIPVVAMAWRQSDDNVVAPYGIDELIEATNSLMPEGLEAGKKDLRDFVLRRNRALAQTIVGSCMVTGSAIGFAALPFADAALLIPVETGEVTALARLYGLRRGEGLDRLIDTVIDVCTVSTAARAAISALKAIPGINVAASVLNAVVAGSFIAVLGEGCTYIFEQISLGKMDEEDFESMREYLEEILESQEFLNAVSTAAKSLGGGAGPKEVAAALGKVL